ncbi:hypothetical protein FKM82_003854 [Ascaphus truei]
MQHTRSFLFTLAVFTAVTVVSMIEDAAGDALVQYPTRLLHLHYVCLLSVEVGTGLWRITHFCCISGRSSECSNMFKSKNVIGDIICDIF